MNPKKELLWSLSPKAEDSQPGVSRKRTGAALDVRLRGMLEHLKALGLWVWPGRILRGP